VHRQRGSVGLVHKILKYGVKEPRRRWVSVVRKEKKRSKNLVEGALSAKKSRNVWGNWGLFNSLIEILKFEVFRTPAKFES